MILLLLVAAAAAPPADASDYRLVNPRAIELFERDSTLMDWALQRFDSNADGYLSIFEADKAAREFKAIADGDNDGQVTPTEYRSARDFVVARWAVRTR
jgi:hypothetical protein